MLQFSFCLTTNTETSVCVFGVAVSLYSNPFTYSKFAVTKKILEARVEDSVVVLNRFRDATAGRVVVSAAILSQRQLSADLLKIYLR